MKRLLIGLISLAFGASCLSAADRDYVMDKWRTSKGALVVILYDIRRPLVHLFLPDGRRLDIAYEDGIKRDVLDASLHRLAEREAR
jgi:hypothetical protein